MNQNPYKFTVKGTTFDFYDLSDAINFDQSAVEHAVKKLVALGKRSGNKTYLQDLHEAIQSLMRAKEQYEDALRRVPRTIENSTTYLRQQPIPLGDQPRSPECDRTTGTTPPITGMPPRLGGLEEYTGVGSVV